MSYDCEQIAPLLSGYIDNELTQQHQQWVHTHLRHCEACQKLLSELQMLQNAVSGLNEQDKIEYSVESLLKDTQTKFLSRIGWTLLVGGICVAAAYFCYQFLMAPDVPVFVKILASAIAGGGLFLFAGVARQQWLTRKYDKYKRVKL